MRPLLLHGHMFKNAGTTFDWSLKRSLQERFLDHREDEAMRRGADYLGPFIQQNPRLYALSSHWLTFPLPVIPGTRLDLVLLFRDPIERIRSVYEFERRQEGVDHPGTQSARTMSFADYVRWRLVPPSGPVIRNYQTRYCSHHYHGRDLEQLYDQALATLESTSLAGLVHRYHESVVLFEYLLGPDYPQLDLAYTVQNRSEANNGDSPGQRRKLIEEELGDILPQVMAANEYDLRLFREAEKKFQQALDQVPDLTDRLAQLQSRCEALT